MKNWHRVFAGFLAVYVALGIRSALKNYAGVSV